MSVSRRTRLAVLAAAASGSLVVTMTGTALAAAPLDSPNCSDIGLQDAQAALDAVAPSERLRLDDLCESIPTLRSDDTEEAGDDTPATTPAAAPDEESADTAAADKDKEDDADEDGDKDSDDKKSDDKDDDKDDDGEDSSDGDRDCADFDSQADAQAALEESSDDPERLDADDDGIACEDHFDTDDQQVAVHPNGGVATGGVARS